MWVWVSLQLSPYYCYCTSRRSIVIITVTKVSCKYLGYILNVCRENGCVYLNLSVHHKHKLIESASNFVWRLHIFCAHSRVSAESVRVVSFLCFYRNQVFVVGLIGEHVTVV